MFASRHTIREALFSNHHTILRCIVLGSNNTFNYTVSKLIKFVRSDERKKIYKKMCNGYT